MSGAVFRKRNVQRREMPLPCRIQGGRVRISGQLVRIIRPQPDHPQLIPDHLTGARIRPVGEATESARRKGSADAERDGRGTVVGSGGAERTVPEGAFAGREDVIASWDGLARDASGGQRMRRKRSKTRGRSGGKRRKRMVRGRRSKGRRRSARSDALSTANAPRGQSVGVSRAGLGGTVRSVSVSGEGGGYGMKVAII